MSDRYFYTLIARAAVRGIERGYLRGLYEMALRPDLTFWLNVGPEAAFEREFRKSHAISYWESGRDMSLSNDLFQSFIRYQARIRSQFEALSARHKFIEVNGEQSVRAVNDRAAQTHRGPSRNLRHALHSFVGPSPLVALRLGKPLRIGAIDAGSNAIRLIVADVHSPTEWEQVETLRLPIRLGHHAFTGGVMTQRTIREAVDGFREFREHMERTGVQLYRAVATSATRESRNGGRLVELVRRRAGLELERIPGDEEARLVRTAVLHALRHGPYPGVILDLGGGSLELNWLRGSGIRRVATLPLGAVRLMEEYGAGGSIPEHRAIEIQQHVEHIITSALGRKSPRAAGYVVGCGRQRRNAGAPRDGRGTERASSA